MPSIAEQWPLRLSVLALTEGIVDRVKLLDARTTHPRRCCSQRHGQGGHPQRLPPRGPLL